MMITTQSSFIDEPLPNTCRSRGHGDLQNASVLAWHHATLSGKGRLMADVSGRYLGDACAEIMMFAKGGREIRLERLARGEEVPREFFYGFHHVAAAGFSVAMSSSSGAVPGVTGRMVDLAERAFVRATAFGVRPMSARLRARALPDAKVIISFTDGFSLSLGLSAARGPDSPILIGGFQALSDLEQRAERPFRHVVRAFIRRAIKRLDHAFFFGVADRAAAIERYDVAPSRSSVIPFGVDIDFWRPLSEEPVADLIVAVGQDPNRDYDLLAAAPGNHPTQIITRSKVRIPAGATHIKTVMGDFYGSDSVSDVDLRRLYNAARAVVVPLKDVHQPSGQSVTLQAMSCGRPVVLTKTRGLWAPEHFIDGENCLLVPPRDAAALGAAIGRLRSDHALAERIGRAARETVTRHFGLDRIGQGTLALARLGLSLWAERAGKRAAWDVSTS